MTSTPGLGPWKNSGQEKDEVAIRTLPVGQRFKSWSPYSGEWTTGTLIRVTTCSAMVRLDGAKSVKTFVDGKGKAHTLATPLDATYWTPEAPVVMLKERVNPAELQAKQKRKFEENKEKTHMVALPGLNRKPAKAAKAAPKKASQPENDCMCGCGAKVRGRFRMGHDGGFYSKVRKIISGEMKLSELPNAHIRKIIRDVPNAKALLKASGH